MNYLILNGIHSGTIRGLLISSLPPVSKPLIRTQVEEIDGRDGDIVTKLGYSAYNKEFNIGLFGQFDIDDVIQYFNSEGTVTFSNEPDKLYRYQIIEQIDFERLLRFRTATVTMHVQPFKYSAVDKKLEAGNGYCKPRDGEFAKNGIRVYVSDGLIAVTGTPTQASEFYIPVKNNVLSEGDYTLTVESDTDSCLLRLIGEIPSNADSFGGDFLNLSGGTQTLTAEITEETEYKYIWLYVSAVSRVNFTLRVRVRDDGFSGLTVINRGNIESKPTVTVFGAGKVDLSINGILLFELSIGSAGYITLDAERMNAYHDDTLMNRSVTGDYDKLRLRQGTNTISWTGDVTGISVENYSRWI